MMKILRPAIFLLALYVVSCSVSKQTVQTSGTKDAYSAYIVKYSGMAMEQMKQYGIPASITLAQGLLESDAGRSSLATKCNNHFGIKCHSDWTGRKMYHDDDERHECFRCYRSAEESFRDHSLFLVNGARYKSLFKLSVTDYKGWAKGLKACGYATSPTYATRLIEIIELYGLHKYDKGGGSGAVEVLPSLAQQSSSTTTSHKVNQFNDNYYVIARQGDTFRSIGAEVGVNYRRLAKFNERDKNDVLEEGEYVWLKKKRRHAPKEYKGYVYRVEAGESMYSISQRFGIRLKSLYKMNNLSPDYIIQVGDPLRIR